MRHLLILPLLFLPYLAFASPLYKTIEDAVICKQYEVINFIFDSKSTEQAAEKLDFAIQKEHCLLAKPDIISELLDFRGDFLYLNAVQHDVKFWIHRRQVYR